MIHRASFRNFKALKNVDITFDSRLTVLVGPNGSGKTSVLQGIHFLTEFPVAKRADSSYELTKVAELGIASELPGGLSTKIRGSTIISSEYGIEIDAAYKNSISARAWHKNPNGSASISRMLKYTNGNWIDYARDGDFINPTFPDVFDYSTFIRFSAARLAAPVLIRDYSPRVGRDGTGLAATLVNIKSKNPERFDQIITAFCTVIPGVVGVRFDKEKEPDAGAYVDVLLLDFKAAKGVSAGQVSSGTLFALGLLTVLLGRESPNVVLLDDLDHGLHPKAQMELMDVFRKLIEQDPDLQIIATSHSPYILDRLEWNEVKVTALQDDGSAVSVPLIDHPLYPKWREAMTPGEFWSHLGDDWVKKAEIPKPTPEPVATP